MLLKWSSFASSRLYIVALGAEACVVTSLAVCFKLAGTLWGAQEFAAYALFRRVLSFVLPAATVGVDIGLPRSVALCEVNDPRQRAEFLLGATTICTVSLSILFMLAFAFPGPLAKLLFGSSSQAHWLPTLGMLLASYSLYVVVFGYWRGRLKIGRSSTLYVLVFAIAPVATLYSFRDSAIAGLNALSLVVGFLSLLFFPWSENFRIGVPRWRGAVVDLLQYGISRFGTAVGIMFLFALPPLMAAHVGDVRLLGLLAFSVTVVGAAGSALGPIGTVLMPLVARGTSDGSLGKVAREFRAWSWLIMSGAVFVTGLVVAFSREVMSFFLPEELIGYTAVFRAAVVAVVPYAYYCLARPVIDGSSRQPYNAVSTALALLAFGAVAGAAHIAGDWRPGLAETTALLAAMLVLATRSHYYLRKVLAGGPPNKIGGP